MRSRKMSVRKRRPGFGAKHKKRVVKKSVKKVKLSKALKAQAKRHGVRVTLKRGNKRVEKSEKMLKKQIRMAKKRVVMKKKKMAMKKKAKKSVRKVKRKTTKRRVKRRTTKFGKLTVPSGMRSVSEMRDQARFLGREHRPLLVAPHGPPQPWLLKDETPAYSGAPAYGRRRKRRTTRRNYGFGASENSLAGRRVNPSGYLSTWYGFPRTAPPSWNSLLLQGGNNFREGVNDPTLSNVGTGFGSSKPSRARVTVDDLKKINEFMGLDPMAMRVLGGLVGGYVAGTTWRKLRVALNKAKKAKKSKNKKALRESKKEVKDIVKKLPQKIKKQLKSKAPKRRRR